MRRRTIQFPDSWLKKALRKPSVRFVLIASAMLLGEGAIFGICRYLAQNDYEGAAMAIATVSGCGYMVLFFQPRILIAAALVDAGINLTGQASLRNQLFGKSLLKLYVNTVVLILIVHCATLIRIIAITPYFIFDDEATSLLLLAAIINYTVKLREGKLQESLAKQALWTSVIVLAIQFTSAVVFQYFQTARLWVLEYKMSVRFERHARSLEAKIRKNHENSEVEESERKSVRPATL